MDGVRLPGAIWLPFTKRSVSSTPLSMRGFLIHTMVGTQMGSWHYHNQPGKPYTHLYYNGGGGRVQVQGLQYRAAGQLEMNPYFISAECEDHGAYFPGGGSSCDTIPGFTDNMMDSLAKDILWCHKRFGFPLRLMTNSCQSGIGYHRLGVPGSPEWNHNCLRSSSSAGKCCPATRRIHQIKTELFPEIIRLAGTPAPSIEDDDMDVICHTDGKNVRAVYITGNRAVRMTGMQVLANARKIGKVFDVDKDDFDRIVKSKGGIYEG